MKNKVLAAVCVCALCAATAALCSCTTVPDFLDGAESISLRRNVADSNIEVLEKTDEINSVLAFFKNIQFVEEGITGESSTAIVISVDGENNSVIYVYGSGAALARFFLIIDCYKWSLHGRDIQDKQTI